MLRQPPESAKYAPGGYRVAVPEGATHNRMRIEWTVEESPTARGSHDPGRSIRLSAGADRDRPVAPTGLHQREWLSNLSGVARYREGRSSRHGWMQLSCLAIPQLQGRSRTRGGEQDDEPV